MYNPLSEFNLSANITSSEFLIDDSGLKNYPDELTLRNSNLADTLPPEIQIICPKSQIYPATVWYCALDAFKLIFKINEPVSWIGYSLNEEKNVTIEGNTTVDTVIGNHSVTVFANDTTGNMGASETVSFTIKSFHPSTTITSDDLNSTTLTSDFETPLPILFILISFCMLSCMKRKEEGE